MPLGMHATSRRELGDASKARLETVELCLKEAGRAGIFRAFLAGCALWHALLMARLCAPVLGISMALAAAAGPPCARAATKGEASFHASVPAARWRALALERLPKGATVRARVRSDGPIAVAFVHKSELAGYPEAATPIFRGRVADRLEFSVVAPSDDDYALVLDNREGATDVSVDLQVEAARADAVRGPPLP
jgi:hypothetical protein